ncbi:hypothetical protein GCM10023193_42120 [Planotetraspora kaengkrachanensis]|uniref:Uncharacterized protein n=1 Tax=Planotetraspora kaengkrachanensis TaxID=575193 RepID=A0A8J3M6N4_9ACTN|nr:hypothetical protein Pka01_36110 [Planotetraspora kaengkrachanensis]
MSMACPTSRVLIWGMSMCGIRISGWRTWMLMNGRLSLSWWPELFFATAERVLEVLDFRVRDGLVV